MDIKTFFNVLLLALSLATVLVTLVSFILYKLRQLADKNQIKDPYQLEGLYFTRIAPHLDEKNKKFRDENKIQVKKTNSKMNLGTMFLILVGVIASSLFAQMYFTDIQERRKKIAIAENYRELVDKGLLQRFDYAPDFNVDNKKIILEKNQIDTYELMIQQLKSKRLILASSEKMIMSKELAYNAWEQFLSRNQLHFQKMKLNQVQAGDLLILPQVEILNKQEKQSIENFINKGGGVIASGAIATFDGTLEKTDGQWAKEIFHIEFEKCPDKNDYPTQFVRSKPIYFNIPNQYTVVWRKYKKEFCGFYDETVANTNISSIEINFDGLPRFLDQSKKSMITQSMTSEDLSGRTIWQAFDPPFIDPELQTKVKEDRGHSFFQDLIILQSLNWLSRGISFQIASWPDGSEKVSALTLAMNADSTRNEKILKMLSKAEMPTTIFIQSKDINLLKEYLFKEKIGNFEIEPYFNQYNPALSEKITVNKIDFKDIEKNRLDIEEEASQFVHGIYIAPDKLNQSVYLAAILNHLNYILSSGIENGLVSYQVGQSNYIHFNIPDQETNQLNQLANRSVASISPVRDFNPLNQLKIYHYSDFDADAFDEIKKMTNDSKSFLKLSQITKWIQMRSNIGIQMKSIDQASNEFKLIVINDNFEEVSHLSLFLNQDGWEIATNRNSSDVDQFSINGNQLNVGYIKPQSQVEVVLKRGKQ